jgi:ABC-type polysaccharide/polyol phosphate transport system ATPase subunit
MPAVSVKEVSKKYRIFANGRDRLKEALSFGRKKYGRDFWALNDINLEVEPGTALGILGRNGAGKSTLLSIISGILQPTSGTVEVNGRLVAILGLGTGFDQEFTGRENVMLNGLILGIERQEILERFDDIVAFADIGEYIDQPTKTYSSGMRSRLAFAVAVNVEPDILIIDETLAVGDAVFKQKALKRMYDLRDSGTTILFVSHSMSMVEDFCSEAILLHQGRMLAAGKTTEVIDRYEDLVSSIKAKKNRRETGSGQLLDHIVVPDEEGEGLKALAFREDPGLRRVAPIRSGTGEAKILSVELLDEHLRPVETVSSDSTITVRVHLEYLETVKDSNLIITLRDRTGLDVFSTDTALEGTTLKDMEKGKQAIVDFTFEVPLQHGLYGISAAVYTESKDLYLDSVDDATAFKITHPQDRIPFRGIVHLPTEVRVRTPEGERQGRFA